MPDKELKPKSFRIDDLTAEQFRRIAEETGGNQQQTLSRLIEIYEMQKNKEELPGKRADIDQMDKYLDAIRLKFLNILADNVHQEEIIRNKLAAKMEKQDAEIEELRQKVRDAEKAGDAMAAEIKMAGEKLEQAGTDLQNARDQLSDKEKLIRELQESKQKMQDLCVSLQFQNDAMEKTAKEKNEKEERLQKELADMQKEKEELENQLAREKSRAQIQEQQAELRLERALLEQERSYQEQIRQLAADHLAGTARYQQMYRELLDQLKEEVKSAAVQAKQESPEKEKSKEKSGGEDLEKENEPV